MIRIIRESSPRYGFDYFDLETKIVPRETILKLRDGAYKTPYKQHKKTKQRKNMYTQKTQKTRHTISYAQKK